MSGYAKGARLEHAARRSLEADGYRVIRSAGSKTKVDLIALKPGELLFVQAKAGTGTASPAERAELVALASMVGARPILALRRDRGPLEWWLLTGVGPKDRMRWTADWGLT
jgi:Holliday junction resolvase